MAKLKPYTTSKQDENGNDIEVFLWEYVPSLVAALVVGFLFLIASVTIIIRMFRNRSWFSIPYIIGGLVEIVGFLARAYAHEHTDKLGPYAIQLVLILIAPALFAASIYMALGRLMRRTHAEHLSIVPVKWLTKLFVAGDVISFLIQLGGGALASNTDSDMDPDIPKYIILVGLIVQVITFGLFIVTSIMFNIRKRTEACNTKMEHNGVKWQRILAMLYVVSCLIMLRSIYRIIEYAMGVGTYLFEHEWPTYALDGVPMLVTMFIWGIFYPTELSRYAIVNDSENDVPLSEVSNGSRIAPSWQRSPGTATMAGTYGGGA